jgi:hypothetical protein
MRRIQRMSTDYRLLKKSIAYRLLKKSALICGTRNIRGEIHLEAGLSGFRFIIQTFFQTII